MITQRKVRHKHTDQVSMMVVFFVIGSVVVKCSPGYVMDSISGGVYKCNGRSWSPRPYCTSMSFFP
jgi:hypothetical protein